MAKHRSGEYLSRGELAGGTVFFILYLLVLPLAADQDAGGGADRHVRAQ